MNILEAIKLRKSCRTFIPAPLKKDDLSILETFIRENKKTIGDEVIGLQIIAKTEGERKMKLNYGGITGHNTFLLGKIKSTVDSRVNFAYLMEKTVLKATEIGVATCWIGYFDRSYFTEIECEDGLEIPSIVILGYAHERPSVPDKFARFAVKASKRLDWDKLFFDNSSGNPLNPDRIGRFTESLEMVRLAPSAGNTQPWRVFWDDAKREFHFFKKPVSQSYQERGLHDIDMGIALSHFELTSEFNNLQGTWIKHPKVNLPLSGDLHYMMTWKCI